MENNKKIVKNNSKGYGYNYAALSDIAEQGFDIPKMKTGTENERDYVFYFDKELNEWVRGAEIVIPEGTKGMNKAQLYGSAVTYARRYTTLMALQLSCDDDKKLESSPQTPENQDVQMITEGQKKIILNYGTLVSEELVKLGIKTRADISNLTLDQASELCRLINTRKANNE